MVFLYSSFRGILRHDVVFKHHHHPFAPKPPDQIVVALGWRGRKKKKMDNSAGAVTDLLWQHWSSLWTDLLCTATGQKRNTETTTTTYQNDVVNFENGPLQENTHLVSSVSAFSDTGRSVTSSVVWARQATIYSEKQNNQYHSFRLRLSCLRKKFTIIHER